MDEHQRTASSSIDDFAAKWYGLAEFHRCRPFVAIQAPNFDVQVGTGSYSAGRDHFKPFGIERTNGYF